MKPSIIAISPALEKAFHDGDRVKAAVEFRKVNTTKMSPDEIWKCLTEHFAPAAVFRPDAQEAALEEALAVISRFDEITSLFLEELQDARYNLRQNPFPGTDAIAAELATIFDSLLRIVRAGHNPTPLLRAYITTVMPLLRDKATGAVPSSVAADAAPFIKMPMTDEIAALIQSACDNPSSDLIASLIASKT